jgi:sugar phosphate isomerase/epimerase
MKVGIGTFAFTWAIGVPGHPPPRPMQPLDFLKEAARLKAQVAQFADNLPLAACNPGELDAIAAFAREHGIDIELGTRGLLAGKLDAYLLLAKRFRAPFVRLAIDAPSQQPSLEETARLLGPIANRYAASGVKIAIENHERFPCTALAELIDRLGTDRAGICLDTVESFGALEPPEQVVSLLGPHTLCLHVKDVTVRRPPHQMGFLIEGCAAGSGRLDVPWLLKCLRGLCPHDFNAVLETWVAPRGSAGKATLGETLDQERRWAEMGMAFLHRQVQGPGAPALGPRGWQR